MGGVRISPQVEHEIETRIKSLDGDEDARVDFLLEVQRMLLDTADVHNRPTHMADYLTAFGAARGKEGNPRKRAKGGAAAASASRPMTAAASAADAPTMSLCGEVREHPADEFSCPSCGCECLMDYATSDMVCTACGICTFVYGASAENVTYEQHQSMQRAPGAAYLRTNHLNELLSQIQGRETKHIPEHVLDGVRAELHKMRVHDMDRVEFSQIDDILHRLNYTAFYDHTVTITSLVTGREVSAMTPDMEADLQNMFLQVQRPWEMYKPRERTNFLCYRYVLYQLCRLLGGDEFLPRFRLLKSRQRLADLDSVWKLICESLSWPYYSVA